MLVTHNCLCRLTFSLRPDEVASVWKQQKLVFKNVIYYFVSALRRFNKNRNEQKHDWIRLANNLEMYKFGERAAAR